MTFIIENKAKMAAHMYVNHCWTNNTKPSISYRGS